MKRPRGQAVAALAAFEAKADSDAAALAVFQAPARSLLTFLHQFLFVTLRGPWIQGIKTEGVAETTLTRISYMLDMFAGLPADPYARTAEAAFGEVAALDPDGLSFSAMLKYAHLCQVMPEAWRGYYDIETTSAGLKLTHVSATFAAAEAADILLSDLGLSFRFHRTNRKPDPDVARLARELPRLNPGLMVLTMARKALAYREHLAEPRLVTDDALREILGMDHAKFDLIQTAFFGLAEIAEEIAAFLTIWWQHDNGPELTPSEAVEWASVNLRPELIVEWVAVVSNATDAEVLRFIEAFSIDYRQTPARSAGGDGLFPPFARFENALLFSPLMVMTFLSVRNAIYGFANRCRADAKVAEAAGQPIQDRFGALVANDFEPVLLHQAVAALPAIDTWIVRTNVPVSGGELDLVIIDTASNMALCLEVKAPLAPQGARLTQRLADRTREGLAQIRRFQAQDLETRQKALEAAAGRPLPGLTVSCGLLVRTCFGAPEAWAARDEIKLATSATLSLAATETARLGDADLARFADRLDATIDAFVTGCSYRWEPGSIELDAGKIELPLLQFDEGFIAAERERAWPAGVPDPIDLPESEFPL